MAQKGLVTLRLPADLPAQFISGTKLTALEYVVWEIAFRYQPFSIRHLGLATRLSKYRVRQVCARLATAGWMRFVRMGRYRFPFAVVGEESQKKMAKTLLANARLARNKGEFLMRALLDFYLDSGRFVDNARPRFLLMPNSKMPLEYDCYLPDELALELNGPQHETATQLYPDREELARQKERDEFKARVSRERGIELVIVKPEDLMPDLFLKKVPLSVRRRITDDGAYYHALLGECGSYHSWWVERGEDIVIGR